MNGERRPATSAETWEILQNLAGAPPETFALPRVRLQCEGREIGRVYEMRVSRWHNVDEAAGVRRLDVGNRHPSDGLAPVLVKRQGDGIRLDTYPSRTVLIGCRCKDRSHAVEVARLIGEYAQAQAHHRSDALDVRDAVER